jgi:PAS domain S-box-containing protein
MAAKLQGKPPVNPDFAQAALASPREADFLSLAETLSSLIAVIDGSKLAYVNPAGCALLGHPRNFWVGRDFWELVHPDDREKAIARARARQSGIPQPRRIVERLVHANGSTIWMDYSVDRIALGGKPVTLVTGYDLTEQRRTEEKLRQSEARLAEAQRIGHIGSWEWDIQGNTILWSDELCRIYGVAPAEFGETLEGYLSIVHPDDRRMARDVMEQALARGGPFAFEHRVIHKNGDVRTIFGQGEVFMDKSGKAVRVAGTGQDITEKRRMAEELKESQERFRLAFMNASIGKAIIGLDRRYLQVNPAMCRMLGYAESELVGRSTDELTYPDDLDKFSQFGERMLSRGEDFAAMEKRCLHKDGRVIWAQVTATVVRDAEGKPLYFIGEAQDITDRKRAEAELRASEERFRNLCMQAPVMLMAFEPGGRIRDVSNYWLQTMGYERREVVGRDAWIFITPDSCERLQRVIEENQRSHQTVIKNHPIKALRKDGSIVDLLCTSVAEVSDSGEEKGAICVQINLTDLQRAEEALRESEERYRALVEHAPEAITVLDVDQGLFVDANAHAEKLFGVPREKLLTMGPLDFCSEQQANGRPSCDVIADEHRRVLEGETSVFEFTHVDAAGREVHCQTRLSRLPTAGRRLIRITTTDITELKHLQEKMRRADRLAAAGALAAGVAHEIGNPLMALSMAAESMERRSCDDYTQQKLALIREHSERISRIVRQMSELARPQSKQRESCDINEIVRRAVDMVRYDKRSNGSEIRYELAEHLPSVLAIEDELTQVCINLALNAFDAMAANPPSRPRRLTVYSKASPSSVSVTFQDTGPGVLPMAQERLFEPFFTTKEAGRGSGLGLSVSYRILEEHEGTLRCDRTATSGAAFVFELPRRNRP